MRKWYPALLVVLAFVVAGVAYGRMPARVPIHWDIHGRANGWGGPAMAAFFMPCILAAIWLLLVVIPRIDPLRANYAKFQGTYATLMDLILTFMFLTYLLLLGAALGMHTDLSRATAALIGLLFVGMGNILPRARRNWFIGIRTPWTLSSDRVWDRTHRVAGYLFTCAGVLAVIASVINGAVGILVTIVVVLVAVIGAAAYSYVVWRQEGAPR